MSKNTTGKKTQNKDNVQSQANAGEEMNENAEASTDCSKGMDKY